MRLVAFTLAGFLAVSGLASTACNSSSPPSGPEATCAQACEARAPGCKREECRRGCNLVLDRLAEGEGDRIIACLANTTRACTDRAWSHCAVRVGPHADGGPPAPRVPDTEDEGE